MTTVQLTGEMSQPTRPKNQRPQQSNQRQQSQQSQRPRLISTGRRPKNQFKSQFAMHMPVTHSSNVNTDETRKRLLAQQEIQDSSTSLVKSTLGKFARDDQHAKRFKVEVDKSVAIPELLKEHLGWVSSLPRSLQLATLIAEKYTRSLVD